jgi:hypothetical protein
MLEKMGAPPEPQDIEELGAANANELNNYNGVIFGLSARFGGIPA